MQPNSWPTLVLSCRRGVVSVARYAQAADVDDITQSAAIRLLTALRAGHITTNASAYAYGIGRHVALDWLRSRRRESEVAEQLASGIDTCAPSHEAAILDRAAVRHLAIVLGDELELFTRERGEVSGAERVRKVTLRRRALEALA